MFSIYLMTDEDKTSHEPENSTVETGNTDTEPIRAIRLTHDTGNLDLTSLYTSNSYR